MGEMFSIPLRNSMKVPLWVGKGAGLLGQGGKNRPFQGHAEGEKPCPLMGASRQVSTTLLKVDKRVVVL